jgi:Lrp/AsnC family transcriptional regulator
MLMSELSKLDNIDRSILRILQNQADASVLDIANEVDLSHTPCWRRIKRLREAGLIDKRVTLLNPEMLGFGVTVVVELTLKRQDEASLAQFERAVMLIDNVMQCYAMTGDKHFMLILVAESVGAYDRLMKTRLVNLPGIDTINSRIALSRVKYTTKLPV